MHKAAVPILLVMALLATGALAEGAPGEARTIVGGGTAQGAALGSPWALRQSYGVSLMRLSESGQGFGARLSLLPSPGAAGTWEASADAVLRVANDSPWYFKGVGGVAVGFPGEAWTPRLRAGVEVGLTAIRGGIGLEAGLSVIDSFPPSRPLEGQVVVSVGMGLLFGFGAPSPSKDALCQREASPAQPARVVFASPEEGLTLVSVAGTGQGHTPEESLENETLLYGLERLYADDRRYGSLLATVALSASNTSMAGVNIGAQATLARMQAALEADCIKAGFAGGVADFEKSIREYLMDFERDTVALANHRLTQRERFLESEEQRYRNPAETEALFEALTAARAWYAKAEDLRSNQMLGMVLTREELAEQAYWGGQRREALARAESEVAPLVGAHPLLGEADFPRERLTLASKQEVQAVVLGAIKARQQDIADTRENLEATPELVYGLDVLLEESLRARNIERGTLLAQLIQDHLREVELDKTVKSVALAAVALGAGMCSGGTGADAVLAVGTVCAAGSVQALGEVQRYQQQSSAFGAKLTSEEPEMAWAIVAVLGAGMDAAAFASVLPKLRPALAAFNAGPEAGDLLALDRKLAQLAGVEASLRQSILRAASAEAEARAAWKAVLLPRAQLQAVLFPGAPEFHRLVHAVYLSGRHGLRRFQVFVKTNEAIELLGEVSKLPAAELAALKRGYLAAVKQVEAVAAHGKALGMSEAELNAFIAFGGRTPGMSVADLMEEMDAWKAAGGARRPGVGVKRGGASRSRGATAAAPKTLVAPAAEPGAWVPEAGVVGDALRYQVQQSGHPPGYAYRVPLASAKTGRVLFDGFDGVNLIECKGPGYEQLLDPKKPGYFKWFFELTQIEDPAGMVGQASRQLQAAKGIPVRWYVAENKVAEAIRNLFEDNALKQVEVIFVPLKP